MNGRGLHRGTTVALSVAIAVIGAIVVVQSLAESTSALAGRLLIGFLMVAAGLGRLYVATRRSR
jgi:hypothetical protein